MKVLIPFLVLVASCYSFQDLDLTAEEWVNFKVEYEKQYDTEEEERMRYSIYLENKQAIEEHNVKYERGESGFYMGMNHFGDMRVREWDEMVNGLNVSIPRTPGATFMPPENIDPSLPEEYSWLNRGVVTPVKNQGACGSCWSFSTTGALEAQHKRKTGQLVSLSEQNLIDCTLRYGNHGCRGGNMDIAFRYIRNNGGVDTESSYPYEARNSRCRYRRSNRGATDTGFTDIPRGDENRMAQAVVYVGPIAVGFDASHRSFQMYRGGVYDAPECTHRITHAVLVVGYGNEGGHPYWLVKNSWSPRWGDRGYFKIQRGDNRCGIALMASYPLV